MIVVDTSALIAVILKEPDADIYLDRLLGDSNTKISAVNAYEIAVVLAMRQGQVAVDDFWRLLASATVQIEPFGDEHIRAALAAYARYGKGLGSKAQLNLCDSAAYALARTLDAPLLFKGEDFPHTDVARCV